MRKILSLIGVIILGGVVYGQVATKPIMTKADEERYTYFGSKQAVIKLDYDTIRKRKWNTKSPNPPVSAREAIDKANAVWEEIRKTDDILKDQSNIWELESLCLMPLDPGNPSNQENKECWYWLVRYQAFDLSGPPVELEIAILLDGTVVRPVLRERE
jgi:hypothetical protein